MPMDKRRANQNWAISDDNDHLYPVATYAYIQTAVLMDIRDELHKLNGVFGCRNFQDIPNILRGIRRKVPTRRKVKR